jgi:hypothetical protein
MARTTFASKNAQSTSVEVEMFNCARRFGAKQISKTER